MNNRAYYSGITQSPYKAMFGVEFRAGLTSTTLPNEILSRIGTEITDEQELEDFLNAENLDNVTII